jgi:hypothetical protein
MILEYLVIEIVRKQNAHAAPLGPASACLQVIGKFSILEWV